MNKQRRAEIAKVVVLLQSLSEAIAALDVEEPLSQVESLRDEEQEYFDNMPESLQGADKGQMAETAISNLDEAFSSLEALKEALDGADIDDIVSKLEEAAS